MDVESILKGKIRELPDYPKLGVLYRDITPLLSDASAFKVCIDELASIAEGKKIDSIIGIEARGFIIGGTLAYKLGIGFIPVRKKGKLPFDRLSVEYELEYGKEIIEMHKDAVKKGDNVLIVDDLLATGGTAEAAAKLVEQVEGNIAGFEFVIELQEFGGRKKLEPMGEVFSLVKY